MKISHFFIDRPIFASVVSIVFVILGVVSFARLPVAQYPEIAPPIINVQGQYPGATSDVVATTVVAPIEDQINGVENMLYVSSNSTADDVVLALQGQNVQVASGVLNQPPVEHPRAFQITVQTRGRLADPDEFANIVVKTTPNAVVRLKEVAQVELAAQDYGSNSYL